MAEQTLTTQEIIKNSKEIKNSNMSWKRAYASIYAALQTNKYRMLRSGDVLFLIKIIKPGEAQMFVFNPVSDKNFYRAFKEFAAAMKKAGYKKVWGNTKDRKLLEFIGKAVGNVQIQELSKSADGEITYRGEVNV